MPHARSLATVLVLGSLLAAVALSGPGASPRAAAAQAVGESGRFLAHLSTDRPIVRPGETVWFRAVLLEAFHRGGAPDGVQGLFRIASPRGDTVFEIACAFADSSAAMAWGVPAGLPGGEYRATLSFPWHGYPPAERLFELRAFRSPRLRTQVEFLRKGYGPGEEVTALLEATRAEGGIPAGARVTAVARVDGLEVHRGEASLDATGRLSVKFRLPESIARGEGSLSLVIEDGGVVETAAKTIPILVASVDVTAYPEGGDLVAGLECGLYVEARTPWGDPADLEAEVVDAAGAAVARVVTDHEGRGRTAFTPAAGAGYSLRVLRPAGVSALTALPEVLPEGVSLRAPRGVVWVDEAVELEVAATRAGRYRVALSRLDLEVAALALDLEAGRPRAVALTPSAAADGVLRVTVHDPAGLPMAERLVFRRPRKGLKVELVADPNASTPGGEVSVRVRTTAADGSPVSAVVGLTVTDDSVLQMVERRRQAPRLRAMALLEPEVAHLEDAWIYLSEDPGALAAVDLLLGTQGWRRFAYRDVAAFLGAHPDAARRALAYRESVEPDRRNRALVDGPAAAFAPGPEVVGAPAGMPMPEAPPPVPVAAVEEEVVIDAPVAEAEGREAERADEAGLEAEEAWFAGGMARQRKAHVEAIRVYAHAARPDRRPGDRRDFTRTVYWTAGLRTDLKGEAVARFGLADAVTSYRVLADAWAADGALGEADLLVEARQPFYAEPKPPLEVTAGDRVLLPVSLVNATGDPLGASLAVAAEGGLASEAGWTGTLELPAGGRGRLLVPLAVGAANGTAEITLEATAGPHGDRVRREVEVRPRGFPVQHHLAGLLGPGGRVTHTLRVPEGIVEGSLTASARVYPTPLASLTQALQALLRSPNGCFEQTSSTNYPLVMAQRYFTTHSGVDPALVSRARELVDQGYKRLVGFECPEKGYEWFGGDPGHEALSAYGVLEFTDMAAVYPVDAAMLERTRAWLLARRDGKGGFQRNARALDSFGGAPPEVTDAYIVWALTEAGAVGLESELDLLARRAMEKDDPYIAALAAGALGRSGRRDAALTLAGRLADRQAADGSVPGAGTSITRSGGEALLIETTSLAVLSWLQAPSFAANVERAMTWLSGSCRDGRFGSTQSTVLALRAILAYDAARAAPLAPGRVTLLVDGAPCAEAAFGTEAQGVLDLPGLAARLSPGEHRVEFVLEGGSPMPWSVEVGFHAETPASSDACAVGLSVELATPEMKEGEGGEVLVRMTNRRAEGQPMAVAVVGLPGGLEPRHEQLRELVRSGAIDFYEVRGREVVLYQRDLAPGQVVSLRLDVVAAVPGDYTGPASRAYLYYTDEQKQWAEGLRVRIAPR
ncbi:MAG: A-macroglobulin complement component [Planctomycetes bacterium]|nr:A-macroglobulin complement component [Planctomycetota bacterium]